MSKKKKPTYQELERRWLVYGLITALIFFLLTGIILNMDKVDLNEKLQTCEDNFIDENIDYFKFSANMMIYSSEQLNLSPEEFNKGFIQWFAECLVDENCEVIE